MSLEVTFRSPTVALPTVIDLVDVLPVVRTASSVGDGASAQSPSDLKYLVLPAAVPSGTRPTFVPLKAR